MLVADPPTSETGRGPRLGVDVGTVRVGVAISDPDGILATPLVTLARQAAPQGDGPSGDLKELVRLARDHEAVEIVVGLPVTLSGQDGPAAAAARRYADALATWVDPVPVRLADERMSTVVAARRLSERGVRGRRQRAVVDQAAAVEILQGWLEARRFRSALGGGERAE
ncbi:MAG: Holliday junction resolvase RuvX [Dactylosporangium sp.]|nr:Holliday junction resolvase RuvX [Dactylosporangium sp.]NNJ60007.1 Holliday junction resolvase RuvX [Dactylosporangium sp.]